MPKTQELFDKEFLKKLAHLKLVVKKIFQAGVAGEKTSRQKGGRVEFSDYREYSPGDDANYIDWNVFGRTEKLFVKEFTREEEYNVYLLLDLTGSMEPWFQRQNEIGTGLLKYAKQLTVALGYVALVTSNRVKIITFSEDKLRISPEFYGEDQIYAVMDYLRPLLAKGQTNLSHTFKELDRLLKTKGVLVVISDLLDATDPRRLLIRFISRGFEIVIIHLVNPYEEELNISGWVKLRDTETNQTRTVFISDTEKFLYRQTLNKFLEDWKNFSLKHGIKYFPVRINLPLEDLILSFLKRSKVLK